MKMQHRVLLRCARCERLSAVRCFGGCAHSVESCGAKLKTIPVDSLNVPKSNTCVAAKQCGA